MEKLVTLTRKQREKILSQLTQGQIEALSQFTRYAMLSKFHTDHYLKNTDWQFVGLIVDPWYHQAHRHTGENLYCDCGRRLKNQFILRSRSTGRQLSLGITHFQQHASIPLKVANEIQQGVNEVHLYMDTILLHYDRGQRFPHQLFEKVCRLGGFKDRESTLLYQRCQLFNRVDLPLYINDYLELSALACSLTKGNRQRLTKAQIGKLKENIANDWRQIEHQLIVLRFKFSERGVNRQALHRIKQNAVNYSLQRRHSRFLVNNWKEINQLTLTKARDQLAIKLRELAYYVLVSDSSGTLGISQKQASQFLIAHNYHVKQSRSFGVQEGRRLLGEAIKN